jgi:hypothetical protein
MAAALLLFVIADTADLITNLGDSDLLEHLRFDCAPSLAHLRDAE